MKRLAVLTSAGLIDVQALPGPKGGIVKRPKRSVDYAGIKRPKRSVDYAGINEE